MLTVYYKYQYKLIFHKTAVNTLIFDTKAEDRISGPLSFYFFRDAMKSSSFRSGLAVRSAQYESISKANEAHK